MQNLGLWQPLAQKFDDSNSEVRTMACWCVGTAVQNNIKCQEQVLAVGALPKIIDLAINDPDQGVRKKAIRALSSSVRNYQPGLDAALSDIPQQFKPFKTTDAGDMTAVDQVIDKLREHASKA